MYLPEKCDHPGSHIKACMQQINVVSFCNSKLTKNVWFFSASKTGTNHCPLCHNNISAGEDGWKNHLMGKDGCKQNPRRLLSLNRQPQIGTVKSFIYPCFYFAYFAHLTQG